MKWENFAPFFHPSWNRKIRKFVESEECDKIYEFLKSESKKGVQIAPLSINTYKCFKETSLDDLKVVICGLSPYHTFYNNIPIADGLCMSCSITERLQPSLEQWYNAVERELYNGLNLNMNKNPDLKFLANQGVLLLNYAFTTSKNKPGDHISIWEPFQKYLFEEVLSGTGVPIIFLGKEASKLERYTTLFPWIIKVSHPASASYSRTEWSSEGMFKKINRILMDTNGTSINWLNTKEEEEDKIPF